VEYERSLQHARTLQATHQALRARGHSRHQSRAHGPQVAVCGRVAGATTGRTRAIGVILTAATTPNAEAAQLSPTATSKPSSVTQKKKHDRPPGPTECLTRTRQLRRTNLRHERSGALAALPRTQARQSRRRRQPQTTARPWSRSERTHRTQSPCRHQRSRVGGPGRAVTPWSGDRPSDGVQGNELREPGGPGHTSYTHSLRRGPAQSNPPHPSPCRRALTYCGTPCVTTHCESVATP
jgi:hypothetical protein